MPSPNNPLTGRFVDLGLPSGILWATCNLGADSPEEAGLYYQWGDTEGHAAGSGYDFSQANYNAKGLNLIEANLTAEHDAASVLLGSPVRMPKISEFMELSQNTDSEWVSNYNDSGVAGRLFTSKVNGKSVFFPAAGLFYEKSLNYRGSICAFWSASYFSDSNAYCIYGSSSEFNPKPRARLFGFSVRAVVGTSIPTRGLPPIDIDRDYLEFGSESYIHDER